MARKDKTDSVKKVETVRERAERAIAAASNSQKSIKPEKEIKAKKNRFKRKGKKVKPEKNRRFHIFPRFFKLAWQELRRVTWPNRRDTFKLTTAVIMFSLIFSAIVSVIDYGLGIIFKKVFLHG